MGSPLYPGTSAPPKNMPEIPVERSVLIDAANSSIVDKLSPVQNAPYF
jgi:hypothetical protein